MTIHEKAIRLIEGGQVNVDGHCVRLVHNKNIFDPCFCCEMDCLCRCDSEMADVCKECDDILREDCSLVLVTNDNLMKQ